MNEDLRVAGLGGVDPHDDARAVQAWRWMQWVLFALSVLAIPAFYFGLAAASGLHLAGRALYGCMFAGFAAVLFRRRVARAIRRVGAAVLAQPDSLELDGSTAQNSIEAGLERAGWLCLHQVSLRRGR